VVGGSLRTARWAGRAAAGAARGATRGASRLVRAEDGQSLPIVLGLVTFLFLVGAALAAHASTALRAGSAGAVEAGDLYAADGGAELGIWWRRNGLAGDPPTVALNGRAVTTTVSATGGGGGGVGGTGWPQWGFDPQSRAVSDGAGPAAYGERWASFPTVPQGATPASPAVADDGFVYVGGTDGLRAYRPDGALAWTFLSSSQSPALGSFIGTPAIVTVGGSRVIVAATDGAAGTASAAVALAEDAGQTGATLRWAHGLGTGAGTGFVGGPRVNAAGTRAYLAARNSTVYAFDTTATGANPPLWSGATGGAVLVPVCLNAAGDRIYVATSTGILRSYAATTGVQQWTRTVADGAALSAPAFRQLGPRAHVYVATGSNQTVRAIRDQGNSSQESWSLALGTAAFATPALSGAGENALFVAADDGSIRKLEDIGPINQLRWTFSPSTTAIRSTLVLDANGALYHGDESGLLRRVLDGGTSASTAWGQAVGLGAVRSGLALGPAADLYAMTASGRLLAVGPGAAPALVTVTATAGSSTVTTTYEDPGAGAPALDTWTTSR